MEKNKGEEDNNPAIPIPGRPILSERELIFDKEIDFLEVLQNVYIN